MDFARELKKAVDREDYGDTNCNGYAWNGP